jgi:hypothetical protein
LKLLGFVDSVSSSLLASKVHTMNVVIPVDFIKSRKPELVSADIFSRLFCRNQAFSGISFDHGGHQNSSVRLRCPTGQEVMVDVAIPSTVSKASDGNTMVIHVRGLVLSVVIAVRTAIQVRMQELSTSCGCRTDVISRTKVVPGNLSGLQSLKSLLDELRDAECRQTALNQTNAGLLAEIYETLRSIVS